ncbi:MAG TPA: F0F1 ATP synthase subunit B [Flavobacteriales bacterium]|jgi:F-type H+-transporting ATPase subunit b|nr:F0F1 ATP synthase subunit B [Flavobacteriales bacterium]HJN64324.1 F0F1 ATP synthase subunit B [Flavobacteriales bacterium]|tara:strand:+ start:439 stop:933 length:495 start_codon:yes stop_codon:yes gene_type:complete
MELVTPAIGLIFWTAVVFILLVILLKKFAWKPILTAVENRNESIENALKAAEKAKEDIENLTADNERILNEAKLERDALLKEAREIKDKVIAEAKDKAKTEAEKILVSAKEQITNEKMAAITELKNQVAELSIEIAEKIIKSELEDLNKQKELVTSAISDTDLN